MNSNFKLQISNYHNKLIVILGPTASGKSDLAVKLAKKYNGEIVSADSRQVYKGLDVGSGKITKSQMKGVRHHLLDVANPSHKFTVSHFQKLAGRAIKQIQAKNHVPFLVGGTGFYIQSIVDGIILPEVKPNQKLRKELEKKSLQELFAILVKLDPRRAIHIDARNPRRLIRAIEIIKSTKKPIAKLKSNVKYDALQLGIKKSPTELKKLIAKRLAKRLLGIVIEVKKLRKQGVSFKRLEELGLEYRFAAQYLRNKITLQQMQSKIQKESEKFAKRQMTWFSAHGGSASGGKRGKQIHWIINQKQAEKLIKNFI